MNKYIIGFIVGVLISLLGLKATGFLGTGEVVTIVEKVKGSKEFSDSMDESALRLELKKLQEENLECSKKLLAYSTPSKVKRAKKTTKKLKVTPREGTFKSRQLKYGMLAIPSLQLIERHVSEAEYRSMVENIRFVEEATVLRVRHRNNATKVGGPFKVISEEEFKQEINGDYNGSYIRYIITEDKEMVADKEVKPATLSLKLYGEPDSKGSIHKLQFSVPGVTNTESNSSVNQFMSYTKDGRLIINMGDRNFMEEISPNTLKFSHYTMGELRGLLILQR